MSGQERACMPPRSRCGHLRRAFDQGRQARRRSQAAAALHARRVAGAVQAVGAALPRRARLAARPAPWSRADLMERGDIYLVSLDPAAGHEQQGKRPVLVISPGKFNRLTGVPVVLPITGGGGFARTAGFAVSLMGAGTQTTGVVRCDQPRALDLRARSGRRLESVPAPIIDEVLSKIGTLFE